MAELAAPQARAPVTTLFSDQFSELGHQKSIDATNLFAVLARVSPEAVTRWATEIAPVSSAFQRFATAAFDLPRGHPTHGSAFEVTS